MKISRSYRGILVVIDDDDVVRVVVVVAMVKRLGWENLTVSSRPLRLKTSSAQDLFGLRVCIRQEIHCDNIHIIL